MTRSVRLRLLLFAAISVLAVGISAIRYAKVAEPIVDPTFTVRVALPASGGLFAGSDVTLRGVHAGQVEDVRLSATGVEAVIEIEEGLEIPEDVRASVHNRSAVGEQYLDLVPAGSGRPYLAEGDVIPVERTSTPVPEEKILANLDALVGSVDTADLRTAVDELGTGFAGTGKDLEAILDGTDELVRRAQESLPATTALIDDASTVLATQAAQSGNISSFARSLRQFSDTVREHDGDVRTILDGGSGLVTAGDDLVTSLDPALAALLSPASRTSALLTRHLPGLEQFLVGLPYTLAASAAAVRDNRATFTLAMTPFPTSCQQGYLPVDKWRSAYDLSFAPLVPGLRCTEPGKLYRGADAAPRY